MILYNIDKKYLNQVDRDGYTYFLTKDGKQVSFQRGGDNVNEGLEWEDNSVRFDKIKKSQQHSDCAGVDLYIARDGEVSHQFSILTEEGKEIGRFKEGYGREYETDQLAFVDTVAGFVAMEPKALPNIPYEIFYKNPDLAETILSKYEEVKLEELKNLPTGKDCSELVDGIKATVTEMNRTFNNIEKTKQIKENFSNLFARDKGV